MVWIMRCVWIVGCLTLFFSPSAWAQETPSSLETVRVFMDCQAPGCRDFDFNRREIPWVSWVRDRQDADIHILVSSTAAGGGTSYEITFLGRRGFTGEDSELTYMSSSTDTSDERRRGLAERFKHGLLGYVARTPMAERLRIEFSAPESDVGAEAGGGEQSQPHDPWNLWVFGVTVGGSTNGQSLFTSKAVNGSLSARRTSEAWKFDWRSMVNYSESKFELAESTETSIRRRSGMDVLIVKSVGALWGAGIRATLTSSTFTNEDIRLRIQPAVEYNVFPYDESSRRSLTFQYRIGFSSVEYDQVTVFDKMEETLYEQSLTAALGLRQPWGTASVSLSGTSFVDDLDKNALSVFGNVTFRIVRGLNLRVFGLASRVRNQIFLPSAGATDTDILLRRQALETSFTYFTNFSLSYTFGSIFNNIVNPRFGGGSGEIIFF